MPRLRLMCGLAGAGKSTYARGLEDHGWVRFSIDRDAYALGLRGAPLPPELAAEIRARQREAIGVALDAGHDVVVDYQGNADQSGRRRTPPRPHPDGTADA